MPACILITQCLQNDFVKPIGRHDPLPNLLHVGYEEARRLMGEKPSEGPVAKVMEWAYQQEEAKLQIIHIRDWHDPDDPLQASHLALFGKHCIRESEGACFVFQERPRSNTPMVDSLTLNDFSGTKLDAILAPFLGQAVKVGLMGVWTEAKITFLAYELRTRYPNFQIGACSALTASSSRIHHFIALDQLNKLLGVTIFLSIGEFIQFLGGSMAKIPLPDSQNPRLAEITFDGDAQIQETDIKLLRYLFRDSRQARFRCLTGGFSGNVVLASESVDVFGHVQTPHVVKIGPQAMTGKERAAFERVESVLGNNAPRITDFADLEGRGAIKYRYASMGAGASTTFQKLYGKGLSLEKIGRIFSSVFEEQLGRFYHAATLEKCNLLEYYAFNPEYAPRIRERVGQILGAAAQRDVLRFSKNREIPHVALFYEKAPVNLVRRPMDYHYFSYVHGDLNGANIIVDARENIWLIDFFHTHRGHVLRDLIKLENDLLYIFTLPSNEQEFEEALCLTDRLMKVDDLSKPPSPVEADGFACPRIRRAYETVCLLRAFYPPLVHEDRDVTQLLIGQLRYAVHTLSFDESNLWQRKWALYTACCCASRLVESTAKRKI